MNAPKFRKDQPYGTIHPVMDSLAYEQNGWFYDPRFAPVRPSGNEPAKSAAPLADEPAAESIDDIADESSDDVGADGESTAAQQDKSILAQWYNGDIKLRFFTLRGHVLRATGKDVKSIDEARMALAAAYGW
jgi:hypothetical protein